MKDWESSPGDPIEKHGLEGAVVWKEREEHTFLDGLYEGR